MHHRTRRLSAALSALAALSAFAAAPEPPAARRGVLPAAERWGGSGGSGTPAGVALILAEPRVIDVDLGAWRARLAGVPPIPPADRFDDLAVAFDLPHPSGGTAPVLIAESPVMEPDLQRRYPFIRSYLVRSADRLASGRFELTQRGLSAMLRTPEGTWMIDPLPGQPSKARVYWLHDLPGTPEWTCHGPIDPPLPPPPPPQADPTDPTSPDSPFAPRSTVLRTVRVAMACTGEYGLHHSTLLSNPPNAADPLAAIVTVIARSNVVFEMDLAVRFVLRNDNDLVVFFNPATDPFPDTCDGLGGADCSSPILQATPGVLNNAFNEDYDLGHTMTRIAGGVAYLRDVCNRWGGVSGIPRGGDDDPYSALVVIHEFGHQFGGNHTFSGTRGRCGNNARLASAWEAGSGSSPLAYAGACPVGDAPPSDNIVRYADPFFHHGSIEEMASYLPQTNPCLQRVTTANRPPQLTSITPSSSIPPSTPFTLAAAATDPDGDPLTFSWEQFDPGERRPLSGDGSADNGQGALFRIYPPALDPSRTFPPMADILSGVPSPGERLPTATNAVRRFRVIARDNAPGAGATLISPFVNLSIPSGSSPFALTAPAQGAAVPAGVIRPATITWTTGGTHAPPFNHTAVRILLSTDGGLTFPHLLGTRPNSASAVVALPNINAGHARLRLEPVGGIYFSISPPFSLVACTADFNDDGFIDFLDLDSFVVAFETGLPEADVNADGFLDFFDLDQYISAFQDGC